MHAQHVGAAGVILYNDPLDSAPLGTTPDKTYNQTWFMPESGTQRGTAFIKDGDPLTPIYPSTGYWRQNILNLTNIENPTLFSLEKSVDTLKKQMSHEI